METIEKYTDCKKEDVIRKVPEDLWCVWLAQAPDEDSGRGLHEKTCPAPRGMS